ncbi:MAG TPA: NAD-dependent epimerase/dehydratase family protein [Candidatus Sulfotelmatobacter sp.]|nr:NAD-dependent epimerase/dehydratase family protein [Candidatus Sulfotelmatobacter sp.]
MPRILIAGCGYVGQAAGDLFHEAGWAVEGWTCSLESAGLLAGKRYPVYAVDITDRARVNARAGTFDIVIHCASSRGGNADSYHQIYLNGARNLLDRFVGSIVVFTSSTSVYAQTDGSWVTEESETNPTRETGRTLLETENLVLVQGGIVARLAGIYGPGRSALLSKFLSGEATVDPESDRFINQVHRDDIAAVLFFLLERQPQANQIYNVVDDQPIRQSECYRWLAERLNRPLPRVGKLTVQRKRGVSNKRVSNAQLHTIGWTPRYPTFADAMEKSILPSFGQF